MVIYICENCGYKTNHKTRYKEHLNRKNKCLSTINDVVSVRVKEKDGIIKKMALNDSQTALNDSQTALNDSQKNEKDVMIIKEKKVKKKIELCNEVRKKRVEKGKECEYCKYVFTKRSNLLRHYKICKEYKRIETELSNENAK